MSIKSILVVLCFAFAAATSWIASAAVEDKIADRISPVGDLCMAGDACASAPVTVASGPRSGEEIYNSRCAACHASGAAGAPKVGNADAWAPRIAKGAETLYTNAINGIGAMPAKGLCNDCSDEEIQATVDYMIAGSQ